MEEKSRKKFRRKKHQASVDDTKNIMKLFRSLSLFFGVAAVCVFALAAYLFFFSGKYSGDVVLSLSLPKEVLRGVPFPFDVSVENNADTNLKDTKIFLLVPRDVLILDDRTEKGILTDSIGDLPAGALEKETYR